MAKAMKTGEDATTPTPASTPTPAPASASTATPTPVPTPTQRALLASAKEQFIAHGFTGASLATIVAGANVTKGALYGYYASKEELFCAVVAEVAEGVQDILGRAVASWRSYPADERAYHMTDAFLTVVPELVALVCAHRNEATLLLDRAQGTRYAHLLDDMALEEVREGQGNLGHAFGEPPVDDATYGFLMSGYLHSMKLALLSGLDEAEMVRAIESIQAVYEEGIMALARRRAAERGHNGEESL